MFYANEICWWFGVQDETVSLDGADWIDVPANATRDYRLRFFAFGTGEVKARVTFTNENTGEYLFYELVYSVQQVRWSQPFWEDTVSCNGHTKLDFLSLVLTRLSPDRPHHAKNEDKLQYLSNRMVFFQCTCTNFVWTINVLTWISCSRWSISLCILVNTDRRVNCINLSSTWPRRHLLSLHSVFRCKSLVRMWTDTEHVFIFARTLHGIRRPKYVTRSKWRTVTASQDAIVTTIWFQRCKICVTQDESATNIYCNVSHILCAVYKREIKWSDLNN